MRKGFKIVIKFWISASTDPFLNVLSIAWVATTGEHPAGNPGIFLSSLARYCHTCVLCSWHLGSEKERTFHLGRLSPVFSVLVCSIHWLPENYQFNCNCSSPLQGVFWHMCCYYKWYFISGQTSVLCGFILLGWFRTIPAHFNPTLCFR